MAELKTRRNDGDVDAFLDSVDDEREDAKTLRRIVLREMIERSVRHVSREGGDDA